ENFWSWGRRADWMAQSMMPAYDYIRAQRIRTMIKKDADEIAGRYAVLVAPTNARGSGPIGPGDRKSPAPGGGGGRGGAGRGGAGRGGAGRGAADAAPPD